VNGFAIGRVGKMARDPKSGKIVVQLDLDNDIKVPNSDSTYAMLISTDLLGSKKVRIVFGEADDFMRPGDTISTSFKKDITEQIDPIISDVTRLTPSLDTAVQGLKLLLDPRDAQSIFGTLKVLNTTIGNANGVLTSNQENIQATLKNLQSITKNLESNNAAITAIAKNARSITDSLKEADLKQVIANLNSTITQLNTIVGNINAGEGTLGKVIKDEELYDHIDSTVANLNKLLVDVKARPYRYINVSVLGGKKRDARLKKELDESGK
jgi:phospholipid/cholesterol/gamma-HCH transport system substrate-binding protein